MTKTNSRHKSELSEKPATRSQTLISAPGSRSIGLLLLLFALSSLLLSESQNKQLFFAINQITQQLPDSLWMTITNLGSTLAGAALLCLLLARQPQLALHLIITGTLCTLTIYGFKHGLDIQRPHLVLNHADFHFIPTDITSPARPSGHTATGFFIAGTAWFFLNTLGRSFIFLLALLIGLSRVAIGVHWPLDLTAGAFIGLGLGYIGAVLHTCAYPYKKHSGRPQLLWLSLVLGLFIASYFVFRPLPYPEHNLVAYLIIYSALAISFIKIIRRLKQT